MNVFISTDFKGHWPVGTSAVIVAASATEARRLLKAELERVGLPQSEFTVRRLATGTPAAHVLQDGEY